MHIRCPHCRHGVVGETDLTEVVCPSCGSSFNLLPATESYHPRTRQIGHFQLLDHLGTDAFGSVWKARDTELDRLVAVKIPRRDRLDAEDADGPPPSFAIRTSSRSMRSAAKTARCTSSATSSRVSLSPTG